MGNAERSFVVAFLAFGVSMALVNVIYGQEVARGMIISFLPVFLVGLAALLGFSISAKRKAKIRRVENERETADRKRRQLLDHQENLGNRIFNALTLAGVGNASGKIRVQRVRDNGDAGYSVFVGRQENSSFTLGGLDYRGYPVVQVDVNLFKPTIHTFRGPYGPDNYYTVEQAEEVIGQLTELVENYSPYRQVA